MPDRRKKLGDFGEQVAATHLMQQGLELVTRKWRCAYGEIDLILRDGTTWVFVEVRTRRAEAGSAEESVGRRKQERLAALAYTYLETVTTTQDTSWRIDVVAVNIDRSGRITRVTHLRNAVEEQPSRAN